MKLKRKKLRTWKEETMNVDKAGWFGLTLRTRSVVHDTWKESAEATQKRFEELDKAAREADKERAWLIRRALIGARVKVVDGDALFEGLVTGAYFSDGSPHCTVRCENGGTAYGALVADGECPKVEDDE